MSLWLQKLSVLFYFLATLHYLLFLMLKKKQGIARVGMGFTVAGILTQTAALMLVTIRRGHMPFSSSTDVLFFLAWAVVLIYLIVEAKYRIEVIGSFVLPVAFLASLYASLLPRRLEPVISSAKGLFLTLHVSTAVIGIASFAFAFCLAVMYLLQERQLKSHRPGRLFFRLPSLDTLDRLSYRCLSIGFPILTVSVITGILRIATKRASFFEWKAVEMWWLGVWLLYAVLLQARFTAGWRGRRVSYLTIILFVLACLPLLK